MEYTNENGYSVKIVKDPTILFCMDLFNRIRDSDLYDRKFTFISTNHEQVEYPAIAYMINKYRVNCRNVHAFAMDECSSSYDQGFARSFRNSSSVMAAISTSQAL